MDQPHSYLDMDLMRQGASQATAMLTALANENRLLLLCQLTQGEKCVSDLEAALDLHQPTLSQQLGVLRTEGLVTTRRDGKRIYYAIADQRIQALLGTLYQLYCPKTENLTP